MASGVLEWLSGFWSGFRGFGVAFGVLEWLAGFCIYLFLQFIYKLCTRPATVYIQVVHPSCYMCEGRLFILLKSLALKYPFLRTLFFYRF